MAHSDSTSRTRIVCWGVWVTIAVSAAVAAYALATPDRPHRWVLLAIAFGAIGDAAFLWRFREAVGAAQGFAPRMAAWNCAHGLVAAVACAADGGIESPMRAIFFLCVAFAAVSLNRTAVVAVAIFSSVAAIVASLVAGGYSVGENVLVVTVLLVMAMVCAAMAGDREERLEAVRDSKEEMLRRLVRVVEFRDNETGGHIERMGAYAAVLAQAAGHARGSQDFRLASMLHDVGKVAVPDSILQKPGALTPEERAVMETHAELGHRMLSGSDNDILRLGAEIALSHHERWDGGGYPRGLAGGDIPLSGRIVAVADALDAMTSDRVYRSAISFDEAAAVIAEQSGRQFDPAVVDAFLVCRAELETIFAPERAGEPQSTARPYPTRDARDRRDIEDQLGLPAQAPTVA